MRPSLLQKTNFFIIILLVFQISAEKMFLNHQIRTQNFQQSIILNNRNLQAININSINDDNAEQIFNMYSQTSNQKGDYFSSFVPTNLYALTTSSITSSIANTNNKPNISGNSQNNIVSSTISTVTSQSSSNAQSISYQNVSNNQFPNIVLYHDIPTQFLVGQIFTFNGRTTSPQSMLNIILSPISNGNPIQISYNLNSATQFSIPVQMSTVGKYYLSIFVGASGASTRTIYTISNMTKTNSFIDSSPQTPINIALSQTNNNLMLSWKNTGNTLYPISQIVFSQEGSAQITFTVTNFASTFQVPYTKFWNFTQNKNTTITISQAKSSTLSAIGRTSQFSNSITYSFVAVKHMFSQISSSISINSLPFTLPLNYPYTISGSAFTQLKNQVVVLDPSKNFVSYLLNNQLSINSTITAGTYFSFNINTNIAGTYIVQINTSGGEAVLNCPIYVGSNVYPLIPDFADLNINSGKMPSSQIAAAQPSSLNAQKNLVLNLINQKRKQFGAGQLYEDNKLDNLAQLHSNDMSRRNYISHYTPQGLSPTARAIKLEIYQQIGQNIGVNSNITDAHYRLARSNIHLRNMVSTDWVRVGLGITLNSQNLFLISQQYSIRDMAQYTLDDAQAIQIKNIVFNYIIANSGYIRSQNINLSNQVAQWHSTHLSGNVQDLVNYLGGFGYMRYSASSQVASYGSTTANMIIAQNGLFPKSNLYSQVGASILYNKGNIQMYLAFIN